MEPRAADRFRQLRFNRRSTFLCSIRIRSSGVQPKVLLTILCSSSTLKTMKKAMTYFPLRLPEETIATLQDLALINRLPTALYVRNVLEDHCDSHRAEAPRSTDLPTEREYAAYEKMLEQAYEAVFRSLETSSDGIRTKTKFNYWVASMIGDNHARATKAQWKALIQVKTSCENIGQFARIIEIAAAKAQRPKKT
jgi:hypothetical protein